MHDALLRKGCLVALASSLLLSPEVRAGKVELDGLWSDTAFDQFIVRYKNGTAARKNSAAGQKQLDLAAGEFARTNGAPISMRHKFRMAVESDVITTSRKLDRKAAADLMQRIALDPNVDYVEVDARLRATMTPTDPYYSYQWGYAGAPYVGINAEPAWNLSAGQGVVVAVIDTGISVNIDISGQAVWGYDFITDPAVARDGDGRDLYSEDMGTYGTAAECNGEAVATSNWHGTHVAGIVAAYANNARGGVGTAFGARVMPVRVLGRCGSGALSDIADAIVWSSGGTVPGAPVNATPAEVINLSLGGVGACTTSLQSEIASAVSRGSVVVVAAGNFNIDVSQMSPANCANVIAVGAVDRNGDRSIWSGGSASNYGQGVDVAAPGTDILSTVNTGTTTPTPPGTDPSTYVHLSGTSMAAPFVSGVAALVQSIATTPLTPAQMEAWLKSTSRPFPRTQTPGIGSGIVDAFASVEPFWASNNAGRIIGPGNKCLDAAGGGVGNGTPIQVWTCNGFAQQRWSIVGAAGSISGDPSGRRLDVVDYGVGDGSKLQLWDASGAANQAWHFTNIAIVNSSGKVMDAVNGGSANGTLLQLWAGLGNAQQTWNFHPESGEVFGTGGKCLDVQGGSTQNGTPVQLWTCSGVAQQKWAFGPNGSLRGMGGKCLETAGIGNGAQLRIADCNGGAQQRWFLRGEIRGVMSNKCLDDPNMGQADGSQVHMWTCHGGANQRWEFHP